MCRNLSGWKNDDQSLFPAHQLGPDSGVSAKRSYQGGPVALSPEQRGRRGSWDEVTEDAVEAGRGAALGVSRGVEQA